MAQSGPGPDDPFSGDERRTPGGDGGSCKEESFDPSGSSGDEGCGPLDEFLKTKPSENGTFDRQATTVRLRGYTVADAIWTNFHNKWETNQSGAYRQLILDLSKHGALLNTTGIISMENLAKLIISIQENLKGRAAEEGRSPLEEVRLFLNDDAVN
jgi:hypothetical protein